MTYEFLQNYWWILVSLLGGALVGLMFVQGANVHLVNPRLDENVQYMGYGHLEKPEDIVPPVGIVFWSFRFMICLGMLMALMLLLALIFAWKDKLENKKWFFIAALVCIPLVYICGQCGWIVAEVGRQPWTIQGLLPVNVAISSLSAGAVKTTFFLFLAIFALFLVIEIRILVGTIKKGPKITEE